MEFTDAPLTPFGETFLSLEVPTELSFKLPLVYRAVKELKARGYIPADDTHMAELCFDEAIVNAMVHGNKHDPNKMVRLVLFGDADRWGCIVADEGDGFAPDRLTRPGDGAAKLKESGRGIPLMDGYLDELRYTRKGNLLRMARRRQSEIARAEIEAGPAAGPAGGAAAGLPVAELAARPAVAPAPRAEAADEYAVDAAAADVLGPVEATREGDVVFARLLVRRIDEATRDEVLGSLNNAAAAARGLVVDMSQVQYVSSVGLAVLISLHKRMLATTGRMILVAVPGPVKQILTAVGLHRVLEVLPDRTAAAARLQQ